MALPASFPQPPKPPPASEPAGSKSWIDYQTDLYVWLQKLRAALS